MANIVLASASVRRVELLAQLGLEATQCAANIDETPLNDEPAGDYVCRLAQGKAQAVATDDLVIAADTTIELHGAIIGKPLNYEHFAEIFDQMSDAQHLVRTGVAVRQGERIELAECVTKVWMRAVTERERKAYWNCGEPKGKAGGYAIQGVAAGFISRIEGSYSNVVGLPLFETAELLGRFGVAIVDTVAQTGQTRET